MKKKKNKNAGRKTIASKRKKPGASRAALVSPEDPRDWGVDLASMFKPIKKPVTLRLDADVVAWFKMAGKGYQTRINRTLRQAMKDEKKRGTH